MAGSCKSTQSLALAQHSMDGPPADRSTLLCRSGGGLNDVQKQVISIMEHDEAATANGELTTQSIKKQLLALEKAINKNRDDRTKFGADPAK